MSSKWPNLLGLVNPPLDNMASLQAQLGSLPGWAIFSRSMAHDRVVFGGDDYRAYTQAGIGAICCLEWNAESSETLPTPDLYPKFADQCREYVNASHGCHVWIVGDAMNCASQWPYADTPPVESSQQGGPFEVVAPPSRRQRYTVLFPQEASSRSGQRMPIYPADYADCLRQVREAIRSIPGHQHDLVLVGAVTPWNNDVQELDVTMLNGDWILYFTAIASTLQAGECDGFAIHTATAGADPDLLLSTATLDFPFNNRQAGFQCYLDFIAAIPEHHSPLPVFLTDVSQLQSWNDANDGWIRLACEQILDYNRTHNVSPVRCLALYQWEGDGVWSIRDKPHLLEDVKSSLALLERQSIQNTLLPVVWEHVALPPHIPPGEVFTVRLQFTNTGDQPMLCSGDDPVRLGYRLVPSPAHGGSPSVHGEMRAPLPDNVGIGESDSLEIRLCAPDTEGTYLLHLGFVKSQFVWSMASRHMAHRLELQVVQAVAESVEPVIPEIPAATASTEPSGQEVPAATVADPAQQNLPEAASEAGAEVPGAEETQPTDAEVVVVEMRDISVFLPASRVEQPIRPLDTLDRILIVETGISTELPLDVMQAHFAASGANQVPFHFMIDHDGTVYRLQNPERHPDPYRRNMGHALVVGLAGHAEDEDEARTKFREAARPCAHILMACMAAGMSGTLEVSIDTLDRPHDFSRFVQDDLEDFCQQLTELCVQAVATAQAVSLVPVVLSLEEEGAPAPSLVTAEADQAVGPDDPAPATLTSEVEDPVPNTETAEPEVAPVPAELTDIPLDLISTDGENLGYAHRDRTGVTLWATGEPGNMPLQQIRRIHMLRLNDILYHYVIDPQGHIYATQRSDRDDPHASGLYADALHIGLQGNLETGPAHLQTTACAHLLARLASNTRLLDLAHCLEATARTPLRLGTEGWSASPGWIRYVVQEALEHKATHQPAADPDTAAQPVEPDPPASPVVPQTPPQPDEVPPPASAPVIQNSARVPQIVNKIGNLDQHPRLPLPVRDLAAVRTICIHHANAPATIGPEQLAESWLLDQLSNETPQPIWPYHFFVHSDGTIDQCNDVIHVCQSVTQGNESIIAICLAGKFTASLLPTPEQLEQTGVLTAWLMQKYFVSIDHVVGHKEIDVSEARCPGDDWNTGLNWRQTLMSYINRHLHPETVPW